MIPTGGQSFHLPRVKSGKSTVFTSAESYASHPL